MNNFLTFLLRSFATSSGRVESVEQEPEQNTCTVLVQRLVVVATLGRVHAAWTAILAGALGHPVQCKAYDIAEAAVCRFGEADASDMPIIHKDAGFQRIPVEYRRYATQVTLVAQHHDRHQGDKQVFSGVQAPCNVVAAFLQRVEHLSLIHISEPTR